jgi:predicted HicB family RNase H-like nuclease
MRGLNYIEDKIWGVVGTVEYEVETDTWHGELITIKDQPVSALVTYEAKNAQELRKAFKKAIWEYKKICGE